MKALFTTCLTFFLLHSCASDDRVSLPPATMTGVGVFACLVDGKVFIDDSFDIMGAYQLVEGGYYFSVVGNEPDQNPRSIALQTLDKELVAGQVYELVAPEPGNAFGGALISLSENESDVTYTTSGLTGQMTITKLDFETNIVSGTFWFDLLHPLLNDTIKIRSGRFDVIFGE